MKKSLTIAALAASTLILPAFSGHASDWTGANAVWSSNANPGWNATGVPNAAGAVANHGVSTTTTTTQDVALGVTVGTLSLTNNSNNQWILTLTNKIAFDQDGVSSGFATISNTNTSATTNNFLQLGNAGAGSIVLADDLLISNTGASANTTGAIQIAGIVSGTGNLTLYNAGSNSTATGVIRFVTGVNTFTGTVLVKKGATTFNKAESFGNVATNTITIGASAQGDATLVSTAAVVLPNNIVAASGSGGTLVVGGTSTSTPGYSGSVTLTGDLSITSLSSGSLGAGSTETFSGMITGAGALTKIGTGQATISNAANDYSGGTTISAGTLALTGTGTLGTGNVSVATGANLAIVGVTTSYSLPSTATLSGGGTIVMGAKTFNLDGTISPGTAGAGTLAFTASAGGVLQLSSTSKFIFDIGTLSDTITTQQSLQLGAGVIDFSDFTFNVNGTLNTVTPYTLIGGASAFGGTLGASLTGSVGPYTGTLSMSGNNLILTVAVPEPQEYAMAIAGLLGMVIFLRRRRMA